MTASIVVPFNPDGAERDRNWSWIRERVERLHPDFELIVAGAPGERWCKAKAVAAGVERASNDVIIMMDADVFVDAAALSALPAQAETFGWAVPHTKVLRLSPSYTEELLTLEPPEMHARVCCRRLARKPYVGVPGGGILALTKESWRVAPIDPRFEGWYGEDHAWGNALHALVGPGHRGRADLFHLWHPAQPDRGEKRPNKALRERYRRALKNPEAMARIVQEIPCDLSVDGSSQPAR